MRLIANKTNLSREEAGRLLLQPKTKMAVDVETVSIENPLPLGIGIALTPSLGFYFFNPKDPMLKEIFDVTDTIITHNGKFDIPMLRRLGLAIKDYEDTKLIAYSAGILDNTLEELSMSILHKDCPSVTDQWRKPNQGNIAIDHVRLGLTCITHACNTYALEQALPKAELYKTIDKPCVELLMEMEKWGLLIDQYRLTKVEQQTMERALPLEKELLEELQVENLASNPQVAEALRIKGVVGTRKTKSDRDSVSEESLKPLNLAVTNKLLRWRSLMKTLTTYIPFMRRIDSTGRIHTHFGFTSTGRWSSSNPNLQNLSRDEKFTEESND